MPQFRFSSRLLLLLVLSHSASSQYVISGVVLDSATREPLIAASVFCQNTTLGTTTNKNGEFTLHLKSGGYDLVFSYTGYKTQTFRVSEKHFSVQANQRPEILMSKEEKIMEEVILRNSSEVADGFAKYGNFFLEHFLGTTPNASRCTLQNPEALKFYYYKKTNRLKVIATETLKIANYALGYHLLYNLDSFVYDYNTHISLYRGYCLFLEMEDTDSLKREWAMARKSAYEGSKLHFMRSYYDSTLVEDGWIIHMLDENNDKKFTEVLNVYDTSYYNVITHHKDSSEIDSITCPEPFGYAEVEIYYPRKISITYTRRSPEKEYLEKMKLPKELPYPVSYIDFRDTVFIMENGYYYDQKDWVNQGYWSWKNLADLLPYDYWPKY